MSVIANELSSSLESFLLKNKNESMNLKENGMDQENNSYSSHGNYFILDHEPTGTIASSPLQSSNTHAVSIPYSSKYRRTSRIRLGSTNSPSSSLSSTTANGSISHQSLKESLNKTISSLIDNCQEKVIIHSSSPSSSYSFTKHSTVIYSPSKNVKSVLSSSFTKSKLSQNNLFPIKKIKPTSLNKESKLSEITFGLKNKEKPSNLKTSNKDDDTTNKVDSKISKENQLENNVELIKKDEKSLEKSEQKEETKKVEEEIPELKSEEKTLNKSTSLAKIEAQKDKELLKKKTTFHKKTLSLPNILTPLTPLSGMDESSPPPETRKRRKSVNFSADCFKSICVFTTTDKPESIKNSKVEVKIDDPESEVKDKDFSELRNYESAWSPVPRNVIHIQKFKSSKAKHVQYELPVSIQSFKLVQSDPEETEDKLTCLKVTLNVQNLNYEKKVVIRYTVNKWKSFQEVEAKYVKCIRESTKDEGDGTKGVIGLDRFVARIPVGEHFVLEEKPGHICNQRPTKMLLVARYEVNNNTYWDNNDFTDYHIELVRINAGYDVPRVSKHGKPIPCPGCSMSSKQTHIIEKKGKEIKNNRRTVRKIGGVFGNFTEAVGKNNDRTNFMADKKKGSLYMSGMDGSQSSTTPSDAEAKVASNLTEEPKSIVGEESGENLVKKNAIPKKKMSSIEKMMRPVSYTFGSPSLGGSPMFSMMSSYSSKITPNSPDATNTSPSSTSTSSLYNGMPNNASSKYNPPTSSTSSLYAGSPIGSSAYNTSPYSYSYDMNTTSTSKYEPSPYGGVSYDPSIYGRGNPYSSPSSTTTASSLSIPSSTSKYNPPNNEYPGSNVSRYDPSSYYDPRSYSTPTPNTSYASRNDPSSPRASSPSPSTPQDFNTSYSQFSEYNFGNNLVKKAQTIHSTQDYSPYSYSSGPPSQSKYDIPFSTFSSFGDNFSNYYNMSPSAVTY